MHVIFFIWTSGRQNLQTFHDNSIKFYSSPKFTHGSSEHNVAFLHLKANSIDESITTDLYIESNE